MSIFLNKWEGFVLCCLPGGGGSHHVFLASLELGVPRFWISGMIGQLHI